MAEFQKVMNQWMRRCIACDKDERVHCNVDGMTCSKIGMFPKDTDWSKYEKEIMEWAAEHPEPVYPTWIEWLQERGIIPTFDEAIKSMSSRTRAASFYVTAEAFQPIPADIAQKLGIKPKED